jgi:hypothetical protein
MKRIHFQFNFSPWSRFRETARAAHPPKGPVHDAPFLGRVCARVGWWPNADG